MGRVRDVRRLATGRTLTAFAGGAAAGVLVMWFAGARPPLAFVPSTTRAVRHEPTHRPTFQSRPGMYNLRPKACERLDVVAVTHRDYH